VRHCLAVRAIPTSSWPLVLTACCDAAECQEAAIAVITELGEDASLRDWAEDCSRKPSLPAGFRLRIYARYAETSSPTWQSLQLSAEAALLKGEQLPPEALCLLDAPRLWPQLLARRAVLAAGALLDASPHGCGDSEEVTLLADAVLRNGSQSEARAACAILESLRGAPAGKLLAALSARQPLHLLDGLPAPESQLHEAAALLAVRYGDCRVPSLVLPLLDCACALLPEVLSAAAALEAWTQGWWESKAQAAIAKWSFADLEALLTAGPWKDTEVLARLISAWLEAPHDQMERFPVGDAGAWDKAGSLQMCGLGFRV
ncbi:unnamed protein product, partial [Symbiodinium natans]